MRSSISRASDSPDCASCGRRRTGSARPRRSASSRWPRPASSKSPIPARAFLVEHSVPAAGSVVAPDDGGQSAAAGRGPGPRDAGDVRQPGPPRERPRRQPPQPVDGRPGSPRRDRARESRRLREPGRRPRGQRARPRPARSRWPSPRRCATGRSRPGTVVIGEVGLLGELRSVSGPGATTPGGGSTRVHPRDRAAPGSRSADAGRPGRAHRCCGDAPRGRRASPVGPCRA